MSHAHGFFLLSNYWPAAVAARLDIALLSCLFVAGIDEAVDDDRDEQDRALDEVLNGVLDVHDRHAVLQDADQQRADDHVADAAAPGRPGTPSVMISAGARRFCASHAMPRMAGFT